MKTLDPTASQVPQPPVKPLLGNLTDIDPKAPIQSIMRLARQYGPLFKLHVAGKDRYFASSQALVDELSDETRFEKAVIGALQQIRSFAGDGLFTAHNDEPNWGKAHRLLMPAFGPLGVRSMFDHMVDVAHQMFSRWERFGPSAVIDVADNMTRLTLDTIALCSFDYRFNSFYRTEMHPFVDAMVGALAEAGRKGRRPGVVSKLMVGTHRRYEADQEKLASVADEVIAERRRDPNGHEKKDLLNIMLNGVDAVTGEKLSDENIRFQMITFLIAGHETTSGLLSFACCLLLKNPEVMRKARAMVDEAVGTQTPRLAHLVQLRYIEQILMETLRLWPTAPAFSVTPKEDTLLAGRYPLRAQDTVVVLIPMLHRDPSVWGEDAEAFRPERFAPEEVAQRPPNAWKPFGNGARACIGRAFAMQEAQLVLIMLLQRFELELDDPAYALEVAETLTLKPHNLKVRARSRSADGFAMRATAAATGKPSANGSVDTSASAAGPSPLCVLYGGNTGSCETFARRIAADAARHGYAASVSALDAHMGAWVAGTPLIVVTATYEGQPPDNAREFVAWVEGLGAQALAGIDYAVFGCGNRQWVRTYQAVPRRVDAALASAGAHRFRERGEADAAGDFFGDFEIWLEGLWSDLASRLGRAAPGVGEPSGFDVEILRGGRAQALQIEDLAQASVLENRELVRMDAPGARSKRHIRIALPEGMRFRSGDYLAVLPRNPAAAVARALARFGFDGETQVVIRRRGPAAGSLPADRWMGAAELLGGYVELGQPATRSQVRKLAALTPCPPERQALEHLASPQPYEAEVLDKRLSVLDLLERMQSCSLDFAAFLEMLPALRARQYSIASSPMVEAGEVSLTVAVVDSPALSGGGQFEGVGSTFLAQMKAGERLAVAVRPARAGFQPPADPATPIVMVCVGSGIAPFRAFIEERSAQKASGRAVGRALLYFGVDHPDVDYLYRDEFAAWQAQGIVEMRPTFCLQPEAGAAFVQHRLWRERADIVSLFRAGAQFYLCGDARRLAPAVRETFVRIHQDVAQGSAQASSEWVERAEQQRGRYVCDTYA